MQNHYKKLEELAVDAFNITVLLKEYCSQNNDTQELQSIFTCVKLLNKILDELALKLEGYKNLF